MEEVEELLKHKNDCDYFSIYKIYRPYSMRPEDWEIIENLINKYKELETIIIALKGANVVINQDLKEFKNSMAIISEICVDESKCHITSREAVEEIRKNIFWKAKGE